MTKRANDRMTTWSNDRTNKWIQWIIDHNWMNVDESFPKIYWLCTRAKVNFTVINWVYLSNLFCPCIDAPVIVVSEQKKFVVKKVGRLSVDVGSTVWAVRGTEIAVSCRASSPSGIPTKIEWLRSYGAPVTERFRGGVGAREGTLTIRKLGRFNEGTYTCRASNKAGYTTALFTAKIISKYINIKSCYK